MSDPREEIEQEIAARLWDYAQDEWGWGGDEWETCREAAVELAPYFLRERERAEAAEGRAERAEATLEEIRVRGDDLADFLRLWTPEPAARDEASRLIELWDSAAARDQEGNDGE